MRKDRKKINSSMSSQTYPDKPACPRKNGPPPHYTADRGLRHTQHILSDKLRIKTVKTFFFCYKSSPFSLSVCNDEKYFDYFIKIQDFSKFFCEIVRLPGT